MHFLQSLFANFDITTIMGYLALGVSVSGLGYFINRWKSGKRIGTGKITTHASKVVSFMEPIASVIYPLPLITMSYLQKIPLFTVACSALLVIELVRFVPSIKENLTTAVFYSKGLIINGALQKYEDADRCTMEGSTLHYIKNSKHYEIELEPEMVDELKKLGM